MKPQVRRVAIIAVTGVIIAVGAFALVALKLSDRVDPLTNINYTETTAIKLDVDHAGLYRLTLRDLQHAGLAVDSIDATHLNLSQNGEDISYWTNGDALVFYGLAAGSRYTPYRTYILSTDRSGREMETARVAEVTGPELISVPQVILLEENNLYDSRARYDEDDGSVATEPWYWDTLQVDSRLVIDLSIDQIDIDQPAVLSLVMWGATRNDSVEYDHDFDLVVNGRTVDTIRWDGETHYSSLTTIPAGVLRAGSNEILLDNSVQGATQIDIMRLDRLSLLYQAPPVARQDFLELHGAAGLVTVQGFSDSPQVFDISDPRRPISLTEWTYENQQLQIGLAEGRAIAVAGPQGFLTPVNITPLRQSNWRDKSHQADLVIVTTDSLAPELAPLVAARQEQGLGVAVLPVGDIFDEFGAGQPVPEAITAFLRHASENWAEPTPRYLFIVGKATYDFRNYLASSPQNLVPAPIVGVSYSGETVSDARLADLDGDTRPELAVGRWPVDSPEEVASLVKRTLTYEQEAGANKVIFTADGTSSEFSSLSDFFLSSTGLDDDGEVERLYGAPAEQVIEVWNDGSWLVSYVGHGSLDRWGKEDVLTTGAVSGLTEGRQTPIVLQFTCLTGFFAHPTMDSISEVLLKHENGPVLLVAATSLTLSSSQQPFGTNLLRALLDPSVTRIGDALQWAKLALDVSTDSIREISDTFGLIGDPSALIARPGRDAPQ
jgi:hypothetical protein